MNSKGIFDDSEVSKIQLNHLVATLQNLDYKGVRVGHFDRLRSDDAYRTRVGQSIALGGWPISPAEQPAIRWFGFDRFTIADETADYWNVRPVAFHEKVLPYKEDTLVKCNMENVAKRADWRVVFFQGLTPMEMFSKSVSKFANHPHQRRCPDSDAKQYTARSIFERWENDHVPTGRGYRLVNCRPYKLMDTNYNPASWSLVEKSLSEKSGQIIVPPTAILEMWMVFRHLSGKEEFIEKETPVLLNGEPSRPLGDEIGLLHGFDDSGQFQLAPKSNEPDPVPKPLRCESRVGALKTHSVFLNGFDNIGFNVRHEPAGQYVQGSIFLMKQPDNVQE
jgi:hypothetical protein